MKLETVKAAPDRRDRLIHEHIHDPYKTKSKLLENTSCSVCSAIFRNGRWQWADFSPGKGRSTVCQACNRIRDNYPAGDVVLEGEYAVQHKTELLNLVKNIEHQEKAEHPLHRLMKIAEHGNSIRLSTTDIHLPKRIGEAVLHAHKGQLHVAYEQEAFFVRVKWTHD